jgi:transcriptional regulator with XRE-family HTH domain
MESVPTLDQRPFAMPTLKQIAELAGVSRSTASRVLNGRPGVHPDVREHVLKVMRDYGFEPDPVARSLASRRSPGPDGDQAAVLQHVEAAGQD